jgi:4-hydroxy-3-polyprenylbenzoate decarboxylase
MQRIVVGVSGASGTILAQRTLKLLTQSGYAVDLVMTRDAIYTAVEEMGVENSTPEKFLAPLSDAQRELVTIHKNHDFTSPIASGTYKTYGMLIIPCSMATLAAVAIGLSDNLLRRAADVTLKERRPLVMVPREAPFSEIHLENMLKLTRLGSVIVPPIPAWYNHPKSLEDVENFIVGRALDALKIEHDLYPRWGSPQQKVTSAVL